MPVLRFFLFPTRIFVIQITENTDFKAPTRSKRYTSWFVDFLCINTCT